MSPLANIPAPKLSIENMLEKAKAIRDCLAMYYTGDRPDEVDARKYSAWLVDLLEDMEAAYEERDERDRSNFNRDWQGGKP
jgi:hypothetical protein